MDDLFDQQLKNEKVQRKNPDEPSMDFFRLYCRLIENHPRKVVKAKGFTCPKSYEPALRYIETCILQGRNLHPFMTRNLKKLKNEDLLLSDWGIYHLHLSCKLDMKKRDGFMERSDYLLMVRIEEDTVYFIKTIPHDAENRWTLKEYIQIIRDNWPELIENNLMKDIQLTEKITDSGYEQLRKAHVSSFVELDDGSLYAMIGGGYASDGTSINAVRTHAYYQRMVVSAEEVLINCLKNMFVQKAELSGYFSPDETIEVHLTDIAKSTLFLKIEKTNLIIRMKVVKDKNWTIEIMSDDVLLERMLNEIPNDLFQKISKKLQETAGYL